MMSWNRLPLVDSIIVSATFPSNGDIPVVVIGKKRMNESVEIVNAFQGKEAVELYKKLTGVKK